MRPLAQQQREAGTLRATSEHGDRRIAMLAAIAIRTNVDAASEYLMDPVKWRKLVPVATNRVREETLRPSSQWTVKLSSCPQTPDTRPRT